MKQLTRSGDSINSEKTICTVIFSKLVLLAAIFVWAACPMAAIAGDETLTLEQCLQRSLAKNPAVLASVARKNAAEWQKKVRYRDFFPHLNMDYSYTYLKDATSIDASFIGIGEVSILKHDNFKMGLHIDQPLFTGFKLLESYNLADLGLQEAMASEQLAHLEIIFQTTAAYFELLKSRRLQKVIADEVTMLQSHLRTAQSFFDNEKIPLNAVLQAKVHLANAEQGVRKAAAATEINRVRLATIIQKPLQQSFEIKDSLSSGSFSVPLSVVTEKALNDRPELKKANYSLEATKKEIILAKSDYYPRVSLQATHNRFGGDPLVDGTGTSDLRSSDESLIGVYATWKLMDWGQRGYEVNQAKAASREAREKLAKVIDAVVLEVKTNYENAITTLSNIEPAKLAVEQAKENLRMNELRYTHQLSTETDVLDARKLLTETEFNLYVASYDYQIWLASLARAAGAANWQELGN